MTATPKYDAVLDEAVVAIWPQGLVVHGRVYSDTKGRFKDGERIRTSFVQSVEQSPEGPIVVTRNTRYLANA